MWIFHAPNVCVEIIWSTEGQGNKTAFSLNTTLLIHRWVLFCKQWRFNVTNTEYNLSNYFWTFWLIRIFNCKVGPNTKMSWGKTEKVLKCKKVIGLSLQKKKKPGQNWWKYDFIKVKNIWNRKANTNFGQNFDCNL